MIVTILCVKPRKFKIGSWLIRKFTKAGFSHVAISMKDEWLGLRKTFDAVSPHTRMLEIGVFMGHYEVVKAYAMPFNEENIKDIERRAVKALGINYSFKGVWHQFLKLLKIAKGNFRDGLSTLYCSEFVTWLVDEDEISRGENMNLDEFDAWIAERARAVPASTIERMNDGGSEDGVLATRTKQKRVKDS